jgi:uncharacterized protein YyaL (SSP411 family)
MEWSKEAFEKARTEGKLVLLDLTASWCHWCHVMDETTYSDPEVARTIRSQFVPIRVDIDSRRDISERYNRGGFPTTAFLSDMGESVWGATYIPAADMKRVMDSILKAKASGEIDSALERARMPYLDLARATKKREEPDSEAVADAFEEVFAAYDVDHGGFGSEPKFPQPDAVDLLLYRYSENSDPELSEAVIHTLDSMAEGIYDKAEGGLFRYSVTANWKVPHYEKMLETNLGWLRNLVHAGAVLAEKRYEALAEGTAQYLLSKLRDKSSGAFFGSQDADEDYYRLPEKDRTRARAPSIDRAVYAGWNAEAASTFIEVGAAVGRRDWVDAGRGALRHLSSALWAEQMSLVRHAEGQELYLFEDQVHVLRAIVSMIQLSPDEEHFGLADRLVDSVEKHFAHPDGGYGDVVVPEDAIGDLREARRSLILNAKWAESLALYSGLSGRAELVDKARKALISFSRKEVEAYGVFASSYVTAWAVVNNGPIVVDVHAPFADALSDPLWLAAKRAFLPRTVAVISGDCQADESYAVVCTSKGCSQKIASQQDLFKRISSSQAGQG